MKKVLSVLLLLVVFATFVGCGSKVKLEPGQMFIEFGKDTVIIKYSMSDDDAEDEFDINMKDSNKDIAADLEDYFSDDFDGDIKIKDLKKGKDYISFAVEIDADDFADYFRYSYHNEYTFEEYAEDMGYDDVEELGEDRKFVEFSNGKSLSKKDLDKYEDDYAVLVFGSGLNSSQGVYFKFPKNILIVSKDLKYEKISNDTIFIKRSSGSGVVVVKK